MDEVKNLPPKVDLLNIGVSQVTLTDLFKFVKRSIQNHERLTIGNVNIHAMNLSVADKHFQESLNAFDIVFCDGFGVKLGATLVGKNLPERFTPPDFIHDLLHLVAQHTGNVFLLGAKPGVAEQAAQTLKQFNPDLSVSGTADGYFDKTKESIENIEICKKINKAKPTVLLVGFGMPLQENWIHENWDNLDALIVLPVGALFDTLSGNVKRGPAFLTQYGFEWLARLLIEPTRLWKRYVIGNPLFFFRLIEEKIKKQRNESNASDKSKRRAI